MVAVTVDAGWREDLGQAVQELQGRETQRGVAGGVGLGKDVENLVGPAADQMEPFESEGRSRTIPDQPLEALPVGSLDTDAPIEAKPAAVIPAEHVLGVVGIQEGVATKVTEHSTSHGVLEVLQEHAGEGSSFVEAEAGLRMRRILSRVTLNLLEEPVHDAEMIVKVRVQRRAETMEEADRAQRGRCRCGGTGLPEGGLEGSKQDVQDRCGGPGPVVEVRPQTFWNGEDELAHGHVGNDMIHQVGCGLGHAFGVA
jgi:hypothetical protein